MTPVDSSPASLPFRLSLARLPQYGHERVLFLYWDWKNKNKDLIDPFIYEHVGRRDIGARVQITKFWDMKDAPFHYGWGFMDDDYPEPEERQAIFSFVDDREADFNGFIQDCLERALLSPHDPFQAILH